MCNHWPEQWGIQKLNRNYDGENRQRWEDADQQEDSPVRFDTREEAEAYIDAEYRPGYLALMSEWQAREDRFLAACDEADAARAALEAAGLPTGAIKLVSRWDYSCFRKPELDYRVVPGEEMNLDLSEWRKM